MHRIIRGLIWARACDRPSSIPIGRPRGAKRRGLSYESALAGYLSFAKHGQWFEFQDLNGRGYCQVDLLCETPEQDWVSTWPRKRVVDVLEVKYSWVPEAHSQIDLLYRPVVERALGASILGIVVCKNVTGLVPEICVADSYWKAHEIAKAGRLVVWHWLGTQIRPIRQSRTRSSVKVPRSSELGL